MRLSRLWGFALVGLFGVSVAQAEADLKIYGSNTVGAELGPALVKEWLKKEGYGKISEKHDGVETVLIGVNPGGKKLEVELDAQGSSTGFKALKSETAQIGMSSRPIHKSEVNDLKPFGHCDTASCEYVAALDGIAIIVNKKNPLSKISKSTLKRIFSGEVTDWEQVGGKSGPIHVYALDENSGTYETFDTLVLGKGTSLVANAKRDPSHNTISQMVTKDANGIGFVGLPFVHDSKAIAVSDGQARHIEPNAFTVSTEDYVLARRLFFYLPEVTAKPLAKQFVDFAVSDAGQRIAENIGFISQEVLSGDVDVADDAPDEYRTLTKGAKRLSLNFRFKAGTTKLDNKAMRDLNRLKEFMMKPENSKKELMLFGFADSHESMPIVSLQLSTDRADNVADLLVKEGLRPGKVRGYGSVAPVASNDTAIGQSKNRRVEVWVR